MQIFGSFSQNEYYVYLEKTSVCESSQNTLSESHHLSHLTCQKFFSTIFENQWI